MVKVVIRVRDPLSLIESVRLSNFVSREILRLEGAPVPATSPPPVPVRGPFFPGDPRGLTFLLSDHRDAEAFLAHVRRSGLVEESWMEPGVPVVNDRDLERLDVQEERP